MNQATAELEGRTVRHQRTGKMGTVIVDAETNGGITVDTNAGRITYTTMASFETDWKHAESRIDHGPEIHGKNAVWIAAIFERLLLVHHNID